MLLRLLIVIFFNLLCGAALVAGALPLVDPTDFRDVFFETQQPVDARDLDPPSAELGEALDTLKHMPKVRVFISGFADRGEGSDEECQKISERRALLVYDWLLAHGIKATQLAGHTGFGASRPIDFSDTETHRRHNRRVELNVQ